MQISNLLQRINPLTNYKTETKDLHLAPHPWKIVKCQETGFVFLENPPGYEALEEEYAWEKTRSELQKEKKELEPIRYSISSQIKKLKAKTKRNKVRDIVKKEIINLKNKSLINLLDVGCAEGQTLEEIIAETPLEFHQKCIPNGIEISKELAQKAADRAKRGLWVCNNAVDGVLEFDNNFFDIIVLRSFLEHEIEPLSLLKNSYKKLVTGGMIVIKVPNFNSFNRYYRGRRWCGFRHPDHVNYFTPESLKSISLSAGYKVRMTFLDRFPLSDSMYAILRK